LFSLWVTFASGYQVVYQALVVILVGLVLYAFLNARRQRLGEAAEPTDFAPEGAVVEVVGSEPLPTRTPSAAVAAAAAAAAAAADRSIQ
jgi:hypothetical protein